MDYSLGISDWGKWMKDHHIKLKDSEGDGQDDPERKTASLDNAIRIHRITKAHRKKNAEHA